MNKKRVAYKFIICATLVALPFLYSNFTLAQSAQDQVNSRRVQLEAELAELENEIRAQENILDSKRQESQSLERDIAILDADIKKSQLNIRAREIAIANLSNNILGKQDTIRELDNKIEREKRSLAQLIRKRSEIDSFSLVEVMLSNKDLSDFFEDIDMFTSIESALKDSFVEIPVLTASQIRAKFDRIIREQQHRLLNSQK